jgi:predicted kinase
MPKQQAQTELLDVEGTESAPKNKFKRGDNKARLEALETSFLKLQTRARLENKVRTICTMECICEDSGVDKVYVHGYKTKDLKIKAQYLAFKNKVNGFIKTFVENKSDDPTRIENYIKERKDALSKYSKMKRELKGAQVQRKMYQEERSKTLNKLTALEALTYSPLGETNVASLHGCVSTNVISPDDLLMHNGENRFYDEDARKAAWKQAYKLFAGFMKRDVAQTVYLLHGLPCSGKSEWFKDDKHSDLSNERHHVFIDACNLKYEERYNWYVRAAKAKNCKICIVQFLVDYEDIITRNASRKEGKQLDRCILDAKKKKMESEAIDPIKEYPIDEVIYVREWK